MVLEQTSYVPSGTTPEQGERRGRGINSSRIQRSRADSVRNVSPSTGLIAASSSGTQNSHSHQSTSLTGVHDQISSDLGLPVVPRRLEALGEADAEVLEVAFADEGLGGAGGDQRALDGQDQSGARVEVYGVVGLRIRDEGEVGGVSWSSARCREIRGSQDPEPRCLLKKKKNEVKKVAGNVSFQDKHSSLLTLNSAIQRQFNVMVSDSKSSLSRRERNVSRLSGLVRFQLIA